MLPKFLRTSIFFVSFFAFVCLFALFVDFVDFVPGRASSARLSDHLRLCQSLGLQAPFCGSIPLLEHVGLASLSGCPPTLLVEFLEFVMHMIHHMMQFLDFILYETV